jgi:hypothetical protein
VTDHMEPLPIAVRAHAIPSPKGSQRAIKPASAPRTVVRPSRTPNKEDAPTKLLVFDTETTTDSTQHLTFGCWRYYRARQGGGWDCVQEGLFHADDLQAADPAGMAVLRRYAANSWAATDRGKKRRLELMTRAQFVEKVLFAAAWEGRARVVGFNLPFDLSRIAIGVTEGRRANRGGFSFILAAGNTAKGHKENKYRPRVQVKHLNSHRAQIGFATAMGATHSNRGDFVDLRTLTFALTGRGHSLDSACAAFGVPGKADPGQHGVITPSYVGYCRQDVAATAALYQAAEVELAKLRLPLTAPYAYSPASLAKATLTGLGVRPVLDRHPDTPPQLMGQAMSAFYGGRAECRIRKTPVPVRLVDFTSTYPTLFALTKMWKYVIADQITTDDNPSATRDVQELLARVSVDGCFTPALWPQLVGYAQIRPDGDIMPVRAKYDPHSPSWGIGINPLTSDQSLWYALPDLVASTLLTGKPPTIVRAIRLRPVGTVAGLTPLPLPGGRLVDPRTEDPFQVMTEQRQLIRNNPALDPEERDRVQLFLKITANAGAYGIWAEYNRQDLPAGETPLVTVYGRHDQPFTDRVSAPEEPGKFCYPPLAAVITSGARLLLALLERCVTDEGGTWAMADTDSMGIVATALGGLIDCPGGPNLKRGKPAVRALSHAQVDQIRERFASLNPYDKTAVPGTILKAEVDAYCYAISAKRYALYRLDEHGHPRLVPASEHQPCSHGLGHLLNPIDPDPDPDAADWITQLWEHELGRVHGVQASGEDPGWYDQPSLARSNVTSPELLRAFAKLNKGKSYADQVKPFNFLSFAPGAQPPAGHRDPKHFRLVAPYGTATQRRRALWVNIHKPDSTYQLHTDRTRPGTATADTHRVHAAQYFSHIESKSADQDGNPCARSTQGLLQRRHVIAGGIAHIGKEANHLDRRTNGEVDAEEAADLLLTYNDPANDLWRSHDLPRLKQLPLKQVAAATGLSERRLRDIYTGRATPRHATKERIRHVLADLLSKREARVGNGDIAVRPSHVAI